MLRGFNEMTAMKNLGEDLIHVGAQHLLIQVD